MTKHIEVHVAYTPHDAALLDEAGIPVTTKEDAACDFCGNLIGSESGKFVPRATVLNDEDIWTICLSCAAPILRPHS